MIEYEKPEPTPEEKQEKEEPEKEGTKVPKEFDYFELLDDPMGEKRTEYLMMAGFDR